MYSNLILGPVEFADQQGLIPRGCLC